MSAHIENSSSASAETPAEVSASTSTSAAADESGACAPGTLQDFVMSLINDEAAKAAYLTDPFAALQAAGLADLTPADVQEVLPLVADTLPADLAALPVGDLPVDALPAVGDLPLDLPTGLPSLNDLPIDLPSIPVDLPAVDGLSGLPALGDLPVELPELGALPAVGDLPGLGDLPVELPELGALPAVGDLAALPALGGLPALGDLPVDVPSLPTLETPLGDVTAVTDTVSGVVSAELDSELADSATAGLLSNESEGGAPTLSHHSETVLGDFAAGAKLAPEEFGGSVAGSTELLDLGAGLVGHSGGDVGGWAGADTVAGDVAAGALLGEDGLAFAAESPLGNLALNSEGEFSIEPADPADLLDVDHLGDTGDAVAGTVAHYVSAGADVVADGVDGGSGTLGGFLTGTAGSVADTLESTTDTVTDGIEQGGDLTSEHLTNLPATDALPLDQLPELPQLPDISSSDLPEVSDVTSNLPVDVPSLPAVNLPVDTSAVTGLVSSNPVTDVVHDSPVGGLTSDVTGHLSHVTDITGDLGLGL